MHAVEIEHVVKQYRQVRALAGIDCVIPQGCFFGLLGPNGAGKSTLINIMAGLTHATHGTVRVLGHDVRTHWRQARQALGVVPQELVYDPFFSVREMLRLQSGYFGLGRANWRWIDELIEILSLSDKADENLARLSGGMKRRVLIAQALVHQPQVVVLDEPTAGVDVELRQALWEFARRLHSQGRTLVLTTHYLEEAEALCERIAILHHGEVVALDDKATLLNRYPFRLLSLQIVDAPQTVAARLPDALRANIATLEPGHLVLRLHKQHDPMGQVLASLADARIGFNDLHTREPGLEEVFLQIIAQQTALHPMHNSATS